MADYQNLINKNADTIHESFQCSERLLTNYCKIVEALTESSKVNSAAELLYEALKVPTNDNEAALMLFVATGMITT